MRNEVYNCDCIEYMRTLPDHYFDIAVCDPPYGSANSEEYIGGEIWRKIPPILSQRKTGLSASGAKGIIGITPPRKLEQTQGREERTILPTNRFQGGTWATRYKRSSGGVDETKLVPPQWDIAPPEEFFDELFRVSKNQIIWGGNYFSLPPTRCFLIWRKLSIGEQFSMAMCEYAWTSFKGNAKLFECTPQRNKHSGKFHPTEKPQELYVWIYQNFVKEGETIFDPMMGSQASRIVAHKMGINYVGCEIDKYYFDKGCEFFDRECNGITTTEKGHKIQQLSLF